MTTTIPRKKGGRPATGSIEWRSGQWWARVSLGDKTRPLIPLDPSIPREDRARARECAALVSERARLKRGVSSTVRETVAEYAKRWVDDRRDRNLASADDDRGRLRKWVLPIIGSLDVRAVKREALDDLVADLDRRVRAAELSWKTAQHAWALVTRMFADAAGATKRRDLRVRSDNPAVGVPGPDRGTRKSKQYLYPDEFARLMACEDVPVEWRRTFAITTGLYLRAGEVNALTWEDVDLDHRVVRVHRSANRKTGALGSTKSDIDRRVPIEPMLVPLLTKMRDEAGATGRVLATRATDRKLSRQLRRCLRLAGVARAELFEDENTRQTTKPITFHDLRATGITWCAVRGDEPLRIKYRAGHSSLSTTESYIREAENLRAGFGVPFPPLPPSLVGESGDAVSPTVASSSDAQPSSPEVLPPGFGSATRRRTKGPVSRPQRWRRRESNPGPKISRPPASTCVSSRLNRPDLRRLASSPRDYSPV